MSQTRGLRLIGYRFSVYSWAARMVLAEAGLAVEYHEANPFDASVDLRAQHPFGRVPVLWDGDFRLYETGAILGYLLGASSDRRVAARERQVSGIIDGYAYWPLVRQVFSHGFFGPACGQRGDPALVAEGVAAAPTVLAALEEIATEALVLNGNRVGAADCQLAPMLGYFTQVQTATDMLVDYPALSAWFAGICQRKSYMTTRPDLTRIGDLP